jgi:hypothetical protein
VRGGRSRDLDQRQPAGIVALPAQASIVQLPLHDLPDGHIDDEEVLGHRGSTGDYLAIRPEDR